ncbi:hypothetical protein M011DRAFT_21299 [Sporormia fimetaria CBS 119925]|uniref:Rhodanese domain-containing protein n=1 Tax=Sporormia fimetaria CBS 119925 TaxID=1340428 RepID=A0A6A6VSS2_9PLEO|nr:hypothetical protein M011DRAFT_21299 [Sporormia fimetaria CBS 119925]
MDRLQPMLQSQVLRGRRSLLEDRRERTIFLATNSVRTSELRPFSINTVDRSTIMSTKATGAPSKMTGTGLRGGSMPPLHQDSAQQKKGSVQKIAPKTTAPQTTTTKTSAPQTDLSTIDLGKLETHNTERKVSYTLDAVAPKTLLEALPKINVNRVVFVDCQDRMSNAGQFRNSVHLEVMDAKLALGIFEEKYAENPQAMMASRLWGADLVVFYCTYAAERSPTAMRSYLNLRMKLALKGQKPKVQKIVLLDGGIDAAKKVEGVIGYNGPRFEEWGKPLSKL